MPSEAPRCAIALPELRRRYDALGPIEELPGERTYLGRCSTFESFLDYGPILADAWREDRRVFANDGPLLGQLAALACEAWPRVLR